MNELQAQYHDKLRQLKAIARTAQMMRKGYNPRVQLAIVCGLLVFAVAVEAQRFHTLDWSMDWPQLLVHALTAVVRTVVPAVAVSSAILCLRKIPTTVYPRMEKQLAAYSPIFENNPVYEVSYRKLLGDLTSNSLSWRDKSVCVLDWVAMEKELNALTLAYGMGSQPHAFQAKQAESPSSTRI